MRVSIDANDPGFNPRRSMASVVLDGEVLHDCITADEEEGMVLVYARDATGNFILDGDEMRTEQRFGKVSVWFTT
jgi:hypothetical protein